MDSGNPWLIPLREAAASPLELIGGKALRLAQLVRAGFRAPDGFCVTTDAYRSFVERNRLTSTIQMELGRKPLDEMRWEEIWDAALRIRSAFLAAPVPPELVGDIAREIAASDPEVRWAVRSSAPAEDAEGRSFAGLHESRVELMGSESVLDAVRVVWASLWSDAALLYRRELALDPTSSAMAVVVQGMIHADCSGVAFARDPLRAEADRAIVEAVPGPCSDLVDGRIDPDRWTLSRPSGVVLEWRPGDRGAESSPVPLLQPADLSILMRTLLDVEALFGWPPDIEWTDRHDNLALLQARPISSLPSAEEDTRAWYLSLRPGAAELARLCDRVEHELIPQLSREIEGLAGKDLEGCNDVELADEIDGRRGALSRWRGIYWDEFIPLAHGVRQLGSYYDEAVRPRDPYEFVGLLKHAPLAASVRNERIVALAGRLRESAALRRGIADAVGRESEVEQRAALERLAQLPGGREFIEACHELLHGVMDVCYEGERLSGRLDFLVRLLLTLAERDRGEPAAVDDAGSVHELEQRLLAAVGSARHDEAREVLRIARVSWRLRDDDNLLLSRIESQVLRALSLGLERLRIAGRLGGEIALDAEIAPIVATALREPSQERMAIAARARPKAEPSEAAGGVYPRQLIGQPAGPGLATGRARRVRGAEDLGRFQAGEVLVCDAIQPTMTQLVPLASAIVERRGGMLIHGAIIARELGIPCVNGVSGLVDRVRDGDLLTVDGGLGIVTVGPPDFDLESKR